MIEDVKTATATKLKDIQREEFAKDMRGQEMLAVRCIGVVGAILNTYNVYSQ